MEKHPISLLAPHEACDPKELIGRVNPFVPEAKGKYDGIGIEVLEE
jgi:hypothetical protein